MRASPPDDAPRPRRLPVIAAATGFAALFGLALAGATGYLRAIPLPAPPPLAAAVQALSGPAAAVAARLPEPSPALPAPIQRFQAVTVRLVRNQTLGQALLKLDLPMEQVRQVIAALKGLFPFRRARPGDQVRVERREGEDQVLRLSYRQGPADEWVVTRGEDGELHAQKREVVLSTEVAKVDVTIEGSLWASLERSGEDPELAIAASDVLAWDVDFYQDVRAGDALHVVVEKVMADGKLLRYGDVLAAEYDGAATGRKRLFRYTDPDGQASYYDDEGQSARRGFLKAPLRLARITSGFGNRIHPLLGYQKAHQGVDYGAPTGTPVWAVGDGVVKQAGRNGGCGISITLHHRNGYDTLYCHLSAVAVSAGKQVAQKQVIGYVGQTGLATGPHLHYAVMHGGHFINPLRLQVPRGEPVPARFMDDFRAEISPLRARLDGQDVAVN